MELDIKIVLQLYREELARLQNENLLLKAEILQMRENMEGHEVNFAEGDE